MKWSLIEVIYYLLNFITITTITRIMEAAGGSTFRLPSLEELVGLQEKLSVLAALK